MRLSGLGNFYLDKLAKNKEAARVAGSNKFNATRASQKKMFEAQQAHFNSEADYWRALLRGASRKDLLYKYEKIVKRKGLRKIKAEYKEGLEDLKSEFESDASVHLYSFPAFSLSEPSPMVN